MMARELEMPLPNTMSDRAADLIAARNENLTLAAGEAVEPGSWDNHPVHLVEHNKYRKSMDFQAADPEVKKRFEHHCQRHETLEEIQIARQAKLQMIAQGGQPSQPNPAPNPAAPEETP
jgi:hypothetical protein